MVSLFFIIDLILALYMWVLIIGAVLSWLIAFNVVNRSNQLVYTISDFCFRMTEPLVRRLRRVVPSINGLDLAPLALILIVIFIRSLLVEYGPL